MGPGFPEDVVFNLNQNITEAGFKNRKKLPGKGSSEKKSPSAAKGRPVVQRYFSNFINLYSKPPTAIMNWNEFPSWKRKKKIAGPKVFANDDTG